jgi:hypothetical protein
MRFTGAAGLRTFLARAKKFCRAVKTLKVRLNRRISIVEETSVSLCTFPQLHVINSFSNRKCSLTFTHSLTIGWKEISSPWHCVHAMPAHIDCLSLSLSVNYECKYRSTEYPFSTRFYSWLIRVVKSRFIRRAVLMHESTAMVGGSTR